MSDSPPDTWNQPSQLTPGLSYRFWLHGSCSRISKVHSLVHEPSLLPFLFFLLVHRRVMICADCREYYVRGMYNEQEVTWPGLVPGEMCRLDRLKDYILHRFLEHDPDMDCVIPEASSPGVMPATPAKGEAIGTQF